MTLELNLSPELEAQLRADALARQVPVETLAAHAISAALAFSSRYPERSALALTVADQIVTTRQTPNGAIDDATRKRLAAVDAGFGMFAGVGDTVDEFMAKRSAEGQAEYDKWLEGQKGGG